jgi:hypothetical protein
VNEELVPAPASPPPTYRDIENLIAAYAELVDDGDFTVLQALPDLILQPIAAGRYNDRFERHGGRWRFTQRRVHVDLVGDVSRHLRPAT